MRMARLIVNAKAALAAVENDFLDPLDRPIKEVHLLARNSEPPAAYDPSARNARRNSFPVGPVGIASIQ